MTTLAHKTVLLTGAAGGIGRFIAKALVKAQANVVCVGRSPASLQALQAELTEMGGRAIALPFDLQNLEAMPTLIEDIERQLGPVDILINNAAVDKFRPFQDFALADIQTIGITNLFAPMALCRLLLPGMLARNTGHIVNISSGAGKRGAPFNSIYSATKAGLINWSEALRLELYKTSVNISVVCPGITDAGMFHALETEAPDGMKVTSPETVADVIIQAIQQNQPEVMLDGLTNKAFIALCQFSPQLGDKILHKVGIVETNRECAHRLMHSLTSQSLPVRAH
ncbi:MAG: SDR family NAD(P)-dependent oxidoreductase [Phormidesmis sp. RL_2_1]|nr:SDR family NAD(P)-dependent oxidoreductase [Phormidesmis sp. RL_2_1]